MVDRSAPSTQLRLEHVYGYRGHQCRNNLFYTATRDIVYFVAGVGVVYNVKFKTQKFYLGHDDDIISLALHPSGKLVATGQVGKAPYVCVWDSETCDTVSILKDQHQRGIACLAFNQSANRLVSVGLEDYSQVTIWDWKKGKALATTRGHSDRIFDVCFNPYDENSLTTCGVKHVKFWTLCGNTLTSKKGIFGKKGEIQSILCVCYGEEGVACTGTLNGDVYTWKDNKLVDNISAHQGAVFTLYAMPDGYLSGSKDGTVALWDGDFKPVTRIDLNKHSIGYTGISIRSVCCVDDSILVGSNAGEVFEVSATDKDKPITIVQGHSEGELWGLAMHPKKHIFATGSDDLTVRLWDIASKALIAKTSFDVAVRSVGFSPEGTHLAIGHSDGSFRVLKSRDLSELLHINDRKEAIHAVRYSPDGGHLAVGSNDNFVDVYAVHERYKRVGLCKGSSSYITHMDWSEDSLYLQANSGASERLFYKMPVGKRVTQKEEIESIHWQSWSCVLGAEVHGIWEKYTDTTDVNAADTCFSHAVVATGDDFGLVKLFRFPCVKKGAKFRRYTGHSAHVTNTRFSADGLYLVTTGGADHAVFQWRVIPEGYTEHDDSGTVVGGNPVESNNEASDSDLSDVNPLDSDLEEEVSKNYERDIYKGDLQQLEKQMKDGSKKARPPAPTTSVHLKHVFGYRGYDCRNNLFYTQSNEIVYHIAAVAVVYARETNTQRHYLGHDDDIMCLTLHPLKDLVATGQIGREANIHVWDVETLSTVSVLKGHHTRGVCAIDFSGDGKKLASVGLDDEHTLVVWDWKRGEKLASVRAHKDKIFQVCWDPGNMDRLVTVGVRHIKFWTQTGGGLTGKRGTYGTVGKADTQLCVTFPKTPGVIVSGSVGGLIYVWKELSLVTTVQAHQGPVLSLHALEKGFVSGGKDGQVRLWDDSMSRCLKTYTVNQASLSSGQPPLTHDVPPIRAVTLGLGKILVGTKNGEILEIDKSGPVISLVQGHCEGEIWGLAHHPTDYVCATMSEDKCLRVWDLVEYRLLKKKQFTKPGRCVAYSPDASAVAVGFNDGSFMVVNARTLAEVCSMHHRKEEISDMKFSPGEGKYLAVGSHDNFVDIYNVLTTKRVGICKGASSYVTHVDWDTRGKLLRVNSGAREELYFEAPRGTRQTISASERVKLSWETHTCVLGKDATGIWAPRSDVTDINAADLSKDGTVIATADDFGYLKLFQFPANGKNARCKKYNGHSAHVTNVRWCHDNSCLATVGGADTALMIWSPDQTQASHKSNEQANESSDSEEESGYDSDVERETQIDYMSKVYTNPLRQTVGTKPQQQQPAATEQKKVTRGASQKSKARIKSAKKDVQKINDLELEFVHGYRGSDTRNNLHYLSDGRLVYSAAGTCVVHDLTQNTQTHYTQHNDDVICLALNKNAKFKDVIATGEVGLDPVIHVWSADSKKCLSMLRGYHTQGVCNVNFSSSGRYLVSVGLDQHHSIAVWKWMEGTKIACCRGSSHRIFVGEFRPDSDALFVTCGVKHIKWWSVAGSALLPKNGDIAKFADDNTCQTMLSVAFGPNEVTFTGTMSGDVYIWSGNQLTNIVKQVHSGPVFCMFTTVKDGLIVTGGKDKSNEGMAAVKLWDQDMKRCKPFKINQIVRSVYRSVTKGCIVVGTQDNDIFEINEKTGKSQLLMEGHSEGELGGLSTHPSKGHLFLTASCDGSIRTWDLNNKELTLKREVGEPVTCCCYSPDGLTVAAGLRNGQFQLLQATDFNVIESKRDRNKSVTQIGFSASGELLAVATLDNSLDFYSIKPKLKRLGYCKNMPSYVTQMDFSIDGKFAQVCTGSFERMVFSVPDGKHVTQNIEAIEWLTWTCILGEDVIGVWLKNSEKGDVNCAHLTGTTLATGDDFGYVKLFDFPVSTPNTKGKKFVGHSAHVTNVRFTHDSKYLLSTGGDDSCIFVWKCK